MASPHGKDSPMFTSVLRKRRTSYLPQLLSLEDRTCPSSFTVFNLHNSGFGSLRQAIFFSNLLPGADVIQFAPWLTGSITLTSGRLTVAGDLTINGPGAAKLAVSGSD